MLAAAGVARRGGGLGPLPAGPAGVVRGAVRRSTTPAAAGPVAVAAASRLLLAVVPAYPATRARAGTYSPLRAG